MLESQACINRLLYFYKVLTDTQRDAYTGCLLAVWSVTSEYWKVLHVHPQEDAIKVLYVHPQEDGHQSTRLSNASLVIGELQDMRLR